MNEKQQQLTFEKGITTIPSDALCSDNALANQVNLIYREGEHRVIQQPAYVIKTGMRLLFVHKLSGGQEHYIYENSQSGSYYLFYDGRPIDTSSHLSRLEAKDVTAIGKTMIVKMDGSLHFFIWNGSEYKHYDSTIQGPETLEFCVARDGNAVETSSSFAGTELTIESGSANVKVNNQEDYNNLVLGLYAKAVRSAEDNKRFVKPFLVRYAVEMYDGSYVAISNPIICYAGVRKNAGASHVLTFKMNGTSQITKQYVNMRLFQFSLMFNAKFDYSDMSDIVKNVVVFASDGINLYDLASDQTAVSAQSGDYYSDHVNVRGYKRVGFASNNIDSPTQTRYFFPLKEAGEDSIKKNLMSVGNFYKIAEIGLKQDTGGFVDIDSYMDAKVLVNLTTQDQLTQDYYTNTARCGSNILSYNARLLMADVKRSFFNGFKWFSAWGTDTPATTKVIYVFIKTDSGDRVVRQSVNTQQYIGHYIYYPDPRAYKAVIKIVDAYYKVDMKEHPHLNGAYYYNGFPSSSFTYPSTTTTAPTTSNAPEELTGRLFVSEVNNPFVFTNKGDISIGSGRILGAAPITQALSQGQFGQYPLIAFTTEGIWALSVNSEGIFTNVHPMSREVALENNPAITQTDGAIFFVSEKGLMVVVGSEVKCVSEQLRGKTTFDYDRLFADCLIAFDYRDSLLWIFEKDAQQQPALIYSIKSGTFAWFDMLEDDEIWNVVNNYPDTLIQSNRNSAVYSLKNRPVRKDDPTDYDCIIETRPMKLENAMALKSILQIRHIHDISNYDRSTIKLTIEASNNMRTWVQIKSLGGMPWKYYRFTYRFNNLRASDSFAGSVLITQERRTERLR